jgi:hypothetical protein
LFALVLIGVVVAVSVSFAMNAAADDLRQQATIAASQTPEHPRTAWGVWLSSRMTPGANSSDPSDLIARAITLDARGDRIRELAAAASLGGLVLMLLTAPPEARVHRDATQPHANGTA